MLSEEAISIALRLRQHVGKDNVGVGPDINEFITIFSGTGSGELRKALDQLEQYQFIRLNRGIAAAPGAYPPEFRGVAGVTVLEPLQVYFDDLDE